MPRPLRAPFAWLSGAAAIAATVSLLAHARAQEEGQEPSAHTVELGGQRFQAGTEEGLRALIGAAEARIRLSRQQEEDRRTARRQGLPWRQPRGYVDEDTRDGLRVVVKLARSLQSGREERAPGLWKLREAAWAADSNMRQPYLWRESLDLIGSLFMARHVTLNAVGRGSGRNPALNLPAHSAGDLSRVDPLPTTFWTPPGDIASKDLYHGFGRTTLPSITEEICTFEEEHKGYGARPAFDVRHQGRVWRVKFGEEHTGPFATRIWWALGYPVQIADYSPEFRIRYDRRILTKMNERKTNAIKLKLLGVSLLNMRDVQYRDPFRFIKAAVLKDGTRLSPRELRLRLFPILQPPQPPRESGPRELSQPGSHWPEEEWFQRPVQGRQRLPAKPELNESLYDSRFEAQIDHLVMDHAFLRTRERQPGVENVGFWDYNFGDHPKRRELRGMGLLSAWIDNWEVRWGNCRLRAIDEPGGRVRLEHVVTDLGAVLGNSAGLIRTVNGKIRFGPYPDDPNDFAWACTRAARPGQTSVPIRDFMPITKVRPFYEMNADDARWMARMIARLTENQIRQALIAAGYDAAPARLLLEKLVWRRDKMIHDLGLGGEFAYLRPSGPNRRLNYDPLKDGPFTATLPDGRTVEARVTGRYYVENGFVRRRPL